MYICGRNLDVPLVEFYVVHSWSHFRFVCGRTHRSNVEFLIANRNYAAQNSTAWTILFDKDGFRNSLELQRGRQRCRNLGYISRALSCYFSFPS